VPCPPRGSGYFTWWSILDQRWASGPRWPARSRSSDGGLRRAPGAACLHRLGDGDALRLLLACSLFRGRRFPISYPFLLYFGQIVGAAVKSYVMFRLDRQRWTRQSLSLGWLTFGVLFITGLI
jgi:mannuronan synthase